MSDPNNVPRPLMLTEEEASLVRRALVEVTSGGFFNWVDRDTLRPIIERIAIHCEPSRMAQLASLDAEVEATARKARDASLETKKLFSQLRALQQKHGRVKRGW